MTLARVQTIKTCMHPAPARTHSPTDQPSWRHRNRMHPTSSHVPHDRNKKHPILEYYSSTYGVLCSLYSSYLVLVHAETRRKKKKRSKAANFHACVVRCPSHTDRCSRHESSRCFVLLHGSKTTRPRMPHRCACMWVLTPCSIYDDDRRQLVTPLIQYKPHARHVFGLTTAREEGN